MTDHQIIHNCILPATANQEAMERARDGKIAPADPDELPESGIGEQPNRQMMLGVMMGMLGMSKEQAVREYDEQLRMNARKKQGV